MDISKLNPRGKLQHLIAKDLFREDFKQVFDAKTGKHIGTVHQAAEFNFDAKTEETAPEVPFINPAQTKLF